jgi:hypothetical protein
VTYTHLLSTMYAGQGLYYCCKRENHIYLAKRSFFRCMLMVVDPGLWLLSLIITIVSLNVME